MFSVSPAELVTIGIIALLVFGPKRLPEIARKAGRIARELREAARELKSGIEQEYRDVLEPLDEAGRDLRAAMGDIRQAGTPETTEMAPEGPEAEEAGGDEE